MLATAAVVAAVTGLERDRSLRTWARLLAVRLVVFFLIQLGGLACLVPGILLFLRLALVDFAVVVEGAGIRAAIRRSWGLTQGRGGQIALAGLGFLVTFTAVACLLALPVLLVFGDSAGLAVFEVLKGLGVVGFVLVLATFYDDARDPERSPSSAGRTKPVHAVLALLTVAMGALPAIRAVVVDWNDVPARSMAPTVLPGDRVVHQRWVYGWKVPKTELTIVAGGDPVRGDLVLFTSPEDDLLLFKRVVAVPGDVIEGAADGRLALNGIPLEYHRAPEIEAAPEGVLYSTEVNSGREYTIQSFASRSFPPFGPVALGEGEYFLLGDNRHNSRDSRWFGPIRREAIHSKAVSVALSFDPDRRYRPRWERWGLSLR